MYLLLEEHTTTYEVVWKKTKLEYDNYQHT